MEAEDWHGMKVSFDGILIAGAGTVAPTES